MNKFTKASVYHYEKLAKQLPGLFEDVIDLREYIKPRTCNPFFDSERANDGLGYMEYVCERRYTLFTKLKRRLERQEVIGTDPWGLTRRSLWTRIKMKFQI